jgi:hypothetical protein
MWRLRLIAVVCLALAIATLYLTYVPLAEYSANNKHNENSHNHSDYDRTIETVISDIESHHDLWLVVETFALVAFTGTLWWSTRRLWQSSEGHAIHLESQAAAMEKLRLAAEAQERALSAQSAISAALAEAAKSQTDVLILSQRAWLRVYVSLSDQPLTFNENGASTSVAIKIANVGNIPATDVTIHAWLVAGKPLGPFVWDEHERRSEVIRSHPSGIAFVLFPNETFPEGIGLGRYILGVHINSKDIEEAKPASFDGRHVSLNIIGCVNYRFGSDQGRYHQTRFNFNLRAGMRVILADPGMIAPVLLQLHPSLIQGANYAD